MRPPDACACAVFAGGEWVRTGVRYIEPDPADPKAVYTGKGSVDPRYTKSEPCPQCSNGDARERHLDELRRAVANLPVPPAPLSRWSFDDYDVLQPGQMHARSTVETWALGGAERPWVTLKGTRGTGKTHLAAAALEAVLRRGMSARYEYVDDLVKFLRAHQLDDDGPARLELLQTVDYLVLDDLAAVDMTPWAEGQVLAVIDYRYRAKTPLLVTTNVEWEELEARTEDRLRDVRVAEVVEMQWASHRPQNRRAG